MGDGRYSESAEDEFHPSRVTDEMVEALDGWIYGDDKYIRAGEMPDEERAIEAFVQGSVYRGVIYRGISTSEPIDFSPGTVIDQRGLSSWSLDREVADVYASVSGGVDDHGNYVSRPYSYILKMEDGSKNARRLKGVEGITDYNQEVLVSGGQKQKVLRVEEVEKNKFVVYLADVG